MKTIYLNMRTNYGTETVDQVCREDWPTYRDFKKEVNSLIYNYRLAGMQVYTSQRCTKDWKD
jgi:hypothetical protein